MPIREIKIPKMPSLYRLVTVKENGSESPTGMFRVRKRVKIADVWTTHTRTFDNYESARLFARSEYVPAASTPVQKSPLFEDVLKRFMSHKENEMKLARGTVDGMVNRSMHFAFFHGMNMCEILPRTMDAWVGLLLDPEYLASHKRSRINYRHEFSIISCIFKFYRNYEDEAFVIPILDRHRERLCAKRRTDAVQEIRFLNVAQEEAFLFALAGSPVYRDLAELQLQTGTRIGEASGLEFDNVDFVRNEIWVRQHLDWPRKKDDRIVVQRGTKAGPIRVIPLTPKCKAMLRRRQLDAKSKIVFPNANQEWLTYRTIQAAYDRAFANADLIHRGTHTLRHTFAVRFLEETKDIYALQRVLGHATLEETQRYAKYTLESVRKAFLLFRGGKEEVLGGTPVPQLVPRTSRDF